jgi:hypothetical protein
MKNSFWIALGLTLHAIAAVADPSWKDVGEITLTLPAGSSQASGGHYVRVTFLKDGTAVKRDFTEASVSNGSLPKGAFEALAKAVVVETSFLAAPTEIPSPAKETVIVHRDERRKFRTPASEKIPTLEKIEAAIDQVKWNKI